MSNDNRVLGVQNMQVSDGYRVKSIYRYVLIAHI